MSYASRKLARIRARHIPVKKGEVLMPKAERVALRFSEDEKDSIRELYKVFGAKLVKRGA